MSDKGEKVKTVDGDEVKEEYAKIAKFMVENEVVKIVVLYSGGGDSGSINEAVLENSKGEVLSITHDLQDLFENIIFDLVDPDFNNDGSSGEAHFILVDGVLKFECDHLEYYTESRDSTITNDLIDTSLL